MIDEDAMTKRKKKTPRKIRKKDDKQVKWIAAIIGGLLLFAMAVVAYRAFFTVGFDGTRAFGYLLKQCEFGPRTPGSAAHQECGDYLVAELRKNADNVSEHRFQYRDKKDSSVVFNGRNIIASFNTQPARGFRVLLCAHWDSRPFADRDPDSTRHGEPVLGANDAASGVAVLLEMANLIKDMNLDFGVDIIFFDLEDYGDYQSSFSSDSLNPFSIGAARFVEDRPNYRPKYGILLDMIGDADLTIPREGYSQQMAPHIMDKVWAAAKRVNATAFVDRIGTPVMDDHVPFLNKRIPVIDLIDFDYEYWHTTADTPDKCSPSSLQQVGDVLVEVLQNE